MDRPAYQARVSSARGLNDSYSFGGGKGEIAAKLLGSILDVGTALLKVIKPRPITRQPNTNSIMISTVFVTQ